MFSLRSFTTCTLAALFAWLTSMSAVAQFDDIINVPPDPAPFILNSDTQLNVFPGGIVDSFFQSGSNSGNSENMEINVMGGDIGSNVTAHSGTTLNLESGNIGSFFTAGNNLISHDVTVNVMGGTIGSDMTAYWGATVNIDGGSIGSNFEAGPFIGNVDVTMSDGSIGGSFMLTGGSFDMSGGEVGTLFLSDQSQRSISGGIVNAFSLFFGGTLDLSGTAVIRDDATFSGGIDVTMSGGEIWHDGELRSNSTMDMSGGTIISTFDVVSSEFSMSGGEVWSIVGDPGSDLEFSGGVRENSIWLEANATADVTGGSQGRFRTVTNSALSLSGAEFRLAGSSIGAGSVDVSQSQMLTGVLTDGTVFIIRNGDAQFNNTNDLIADGTLSLVETTVPPRGDDEINAPADTIPKGLRTGQTLNMGPGSEYGMHFAAIESTINVEGGSLGEWARLLDSEMNLYEGTVGGRLRAFGQSSVKIYDGVLQGLIELRDQSSIDLFGGVLGSQTIVDGTKVNVFGGEIFKTTLWSGATLNILAGVTHGVHAPPGCEVNLAGTEFQLREIGTGNLVMDLTPLIASGQRVEVSERDYDLVGTLLDGSPFSFRLNSSFVNNQDLVSAGATLTIGLSIPDLLPTISPDDITVTRGLLVTGGAPELTQSDNQDLSLRRRTSDIQSVTEFEVVSTSPVEDPSILQFKLESSVFARSAVTQSLYLFNFDTEEFELIDTRDARRFSDQVVIQNIAGDLSRMVSDTGEMKARIRYQSPNPRQQFSSNIDQAVWIVR